MFFKSSVHVRLSAFYFCYFALLGSLIPFWGLYLQSLNFSAEQIGKLMSIMMFSKIIVPNIWGWLSDKTGHRLRIVRLGAFLTWVCFFGVFFSNQFWWLACVMTAYSIFWNAILPQFEVITLGHLADETHRYSRVRLWGSIGFVIAVMGLGKVFDYVNINRLPIFISVIMALIWASSLRVSERIKPLAATDNVDPFWKRLLTKKISAFFAACFFMQLAHGIYYSFFSVYMENIGYKHSTIGNLWALGVTAEIGVFLMMHHWIHRWGVRRILLASFFIAALRWCLIGLFANYLPVLLLAQCMHAATFGSFHAAAIYWVHHTFKGKQEGQAQAFYGAISFGLGGALGALLSGYLWDYLGAARIFLMASLIALMAWVIAWYFFERDEINA